MLKKNFETFLKERVFFNTPDKVGVSAKTESTKKRRHGKIDLNARRIKFFNINAPLLQIGNVVLSDVAQNETP